MSKGEKGLEDLSALLTEVKQGRTAPVYLLYGDEFLCHSAFKSLLDALLPEDKRTLNYEALDGSVTSVGEIIGRINTFPLMPGPKVVAVRGTRVFLSKMSADDLFRKAKEAFDEDKLKVAARLLADGLSAAGLSFEDARAGGVKGLAATSGATEGGTGEQREPWLHAVLDYCLENRISISCDESEDRLLDQALLGGIPETNHLILVAAGVDRRKKLYKTIKELGVVFDCTISEGNRAADERRRQGFFRDRMKSRLQRSGKALVAGAFEALYEKTGPDLGVFENEVEKLVSFVGDRRDVLPQDVQETAKQSRQDPVYEFTNALGEKDPQRMLLLLNGLLETGLFPLQILSAMANQVRRLILAKDLAAHTGRGGWRRGMPFRDFQLSVLPGLQKEPENPLVKGSHPFVLFKTMSHSDNYSLQELSAAMAACLWADEQLKTTPQIPRLILERIIFKICSVSASA